MTKKMQISSLQVAAMMAGSSVMFPYTFLPVLRVGPANQDAWLVIVLSLLYTIIFCVPILILINKFRGLDVPELAETIAGKAAGKAAMCLLSLFVFFCLFACMQAMAIYLKLYILAETPLWVINAFLLIPLTYASIKGVGTIGRLATLVVPFIIVTIVFFFVLGLKDMKLDNIMPIFADSTIADINYGAMVTGARFSEIIILGIFSYYLKDNVSINGTFFKGLLTYAVVFLLITLSTLLLLGSGVAKLLNNPFLSYARQVGGGDIMQRVQALAIFTWFAGSILKLMIYNYMASFLLERMVGNKKLQSKHYAVMVSIAAFMIANIKYLSRMSTLHYVNSQLIFSSIVFSVVFVMPTILLVIYLFRFKTVNKTAADKINAKKQQEQTPPQPQAMPDTQSEQPEDP